MQNQRIKIQITDNTIDNFVMITPSKQQVAFFPKEESQVIPGRTSDYTSDTNPETRTENTSTRAFINRIKDESNGAVDGSLNYSLIGDVPDNGHNHSLDFRYRTFNVNSSHTETDYIGSVSIDIPTIINSNFCNFKQITSTLGLQDFFSDSSISSALSSITSGLQRLRIPTNCFNTILTDPTDITNNNGSNIQKNYGTYYLLLSPKYITTSVLDITRAYHLEWEDMPTNAINNDSADGTIIQYDPLRVRRTIIDVDKTKFLGTIWNFETNPLQAGRLYSSVVEIWDSTQTTLKQTKVITENIFNFNNTGSNTQLVLQPDIIGYDASSETISVGDILRIYPKESSFNNILIQVEYTNPSTLINNMVSFMLNDVVRDMTSGIFDIYDENGWNIDSSGNIDGNVIQRYQITQFGTFEARKKLK